jgi:hypothetical protein
VTYCDIGVWAMNEGTAACVSHLCHGTELYAYLSSNHGEITLVTCNANQNGGYAAYCSDLSYMGVSNTYLTNSYTLDAFCTGMAFIRSGSSTIYTLSPPLNIVGNYNSMIQG